MATSWSGSTVNKPVKELYGMSTDTKPIDGLGTGSTFYEFNTGAVWAYSAENSNPITSTGWWEI